MATDQLNKLPTHPQTVSSESNNLSDPDAGLKIAIDFAWLLFWGVILAVFWWSSSISSVYTTTIGSSGLRVHVFGILIQEEGYFFPDPEYRHSGFPFGQVLFNGIFLMLVFAAVYCSWKVLVEIVRCFPRKDTPA